MDLYLQWLNIPLGPRPPDHYLLLGLVRFETAEERIRRASRERMKKVRPLCLKYPEDGTRLLNEIATAQVCLLDPEQKDEYDRTLGAAAGTTDKRIAPNTAQDEPRIAAESAPVRVGIDLGTAYSSLSWIGPQGRVESLALANGRLQMASAVYFGRPGEVVVGDEVLERAAAEPGRLAQGFMTQLGKPEFRRIGPDEDSIPFEADGKRWAPEELAALVLRKLLDAAQDKLGAIEVAVLAVPAAFDDLGRRALREAARRAGLENVQLVDEPAAAAIAYGQMLVSKGEFHSIEEVYRDQQVLLFALRTGTFEAAILKLSADGAFEVVASNGDDRLGVEDWDIALSETIVERLAAVMPVDPSVDPTFMRELRRRAADARETLTTARQAQIGTAHAGREYTCTISRRDFQRCTKHLLARIQAPLEELFGKCHTSWSEIQRVIVIGEGARLPAVIATLEGWAGRTLDRTLTADTAVADGAALFAARKAQEPPPQALAGREKLGTASAEMDRNKESSQRSPLDDTIIKDPIETTRPDMTTTRVDDDSPAPAGATQPDSIAAPGRDLAPSEPTEGEWEDPIPEVLAPSDPGLNGMLARALELAERGDFDQAYKTLDLAKRLRPGTPEQYYVRARVYLIQGEPRHALKENQKALGIDPTAPVCYLHAECLLALGRPAEAADLAREGLIREGRSRGRHLLARSYELQGLDRKAAAECEVAWQIAALVERDRASADRIGADLKRMRGKLR